jgi:hypothetical protein
LKPKRLYHNKSGQALIVSSLIIAVLLISTAYYVLEINTTVTMEQTRLYSVFFTTKQSTVNTVINALVNMSNGGDTGILSADLERLTAAVENYSYGGRYDLSSAPLDSTPYQAGLLISWGINGLGISSAYVSFALNFSSPREAYSSAYEVNVTTDLTLQGFSTVNGTQKIVSVICQVYNENNTAMANDIALLYQETGGPWTIVDSSSGLKMNDYGNGTYLASFDTYAQGVLQVSARVHDLRGIFVMANTTCSEN